MSHKQVVEELFVYFHELFDESGDSKLGSNLADDNILSCSDPTDNSEPSKSSILNGGAEPHKSPEFCENQSEIYSVTENKMKSDAPVECNEKALNVPKRTKHVELPTMHTDFAEPSISSYQQQKQRLEKILEQVTALDAQSDKVNSKSNFLFMGDQPNIAAETDAQEQAMLKDGVSLLSNNEQFHSLSSKWFDNGRPNWAQEKFDILLVEVNGLQLAMPLVALGHIQKIDEKFTPLFGQQDWFMGLQNSTNGNVKIVNTSKFVMPERYRDDTSYAYVVSISDLSWGLAVDNIHQPITVEPNDIRWRNHRASRPWMAGTLKNHMCLLVDIPALGEILQREDKNRL